MKAGKYPTTVTVKLNNTDIFTMYTNSQEFLDQNKLSNKTYKCTDVKINSETKLVYEVDLSFYN